MLLPVALDVRSRPCLVVGGGPVGARKVASLLECGASVTLISPALSSEAQVLAARCKYLPRPFEGDDCAGMVLVYACTPSREVNDSIARAARRVGAWCCVADDASAGDLHGAAAVRRGDICIGISTGGASPALAKHLKSRVEESVGAEYEVLLGWMGAARDELKSREGEQSERANVWRQVLASGVLEMLRRGREDEAREMFEEIVSAQVGELPGD